MKYNYKKIIAEAPVVIFRNRGQSPEVISKQQVMVYVNAILHRVVNETGDSSDDVMSQAAVTNELNKKLDKPTSFVNANLPIWDTSTGTIKDSGKSLNDLGDVISGDLDKLEAKLNENIIKNPDYTYIVVNATSLDFSILADTVEVDWGDGTTGSQVNGGSAINIDHTYTDGIKYHLVTIKKLENRQAGWAYAISTSGIEAYIGTKTENIFNDGPDGIDYYINLKKVVYADGLTTVRLPAAVKEPVIIPESCTTLNYFLTDETKSAIPKVIIQNNKLLAQTTISGSFQYIAKIVVPKEYINAYKTATGWSVYADKIVYEIDSSDLPDLSGYAEKNSYNTFTKPQYIKPDSDSELGWAINKKDSNDYTSYEYGKILHTLDNIHTMLTFLFPDKSGTLALTSDTEAAKAYADSLNVIYIESSLLGE